MIIRVKLSTGFDCRDGLKRTTFSDCCLRILIYLAVNDTRLVSAREIANGYGISVHHAAKAGQWLARHGYVAATRFFYFHCQCNLNPSYN